MKKKLLLSIIMLFVLSVFMIRVDANEFLPLADDLPAKAPESIPTDGSTVKATVDGGFDLSVIKFPKAGGGTVDGMHLRKIVIGTQKSSLTDITSGIPDGWTPSTKNSTDFVNNLFSNWFTAYCLDSNKDYPEYGVFSFENYEETTPDNVQDKADSILRAALFNDNSLKSIFTAVENQFNGEYYIFMPVLAPEMVAVKESDKDSNNNRRTATMETSYYYSSSFAKDGYKFKLTGTPTTGSVPIGQYTCRSADANATCNVVYRVDEANGSNYYVTVYTIDEYTFDPEVADNLVLDFEDEHGTEVTFKITALRFVRPFSSEFRVITYVANDSIAEFLNVAASDKFYLDSDHTIENISVKTDVKKVAFLNYVAKDDRNITNYNHALWIVEHSYPTLELDKALEIAGVDKTKLDTQLKTLYSITGTDEGAAALLQKTKQNVVYGVTQYAIWATVGNKVKDGDNDTVTLGKTMTFKVGTEDFELNKLYNYLLQDRAEYNGYSDPKIYTNEITLSSPTKEYAGETADGYLYGPFKANYNAVVETNTPKIQVIITNTDKTGIKVLASDKKTDITTTGVAKGEEFYFEVGKKANIGNIDFTLKVEGVQTFKPAVNRGRVYYAVNSPSSLQNAMSGGKVTSETIQGEFKVITNAKTGVENVAMLLMVTLVAFTLGYLVLSYKNKPIQLS